MIIAAALIEGLAFFHAPSAGERVHPGAKQDRADGHPTTAALRDGRGDGQRDVAQGTAIAVVGHHRGMGKDRRRAATDGLRLDRGGREQAGAERRAGADDGLPPADPLGS